MIEEDFKQAKQAALRLLTVRGYFVSELKRKLQRSFSEEAADDAIEQCRRFGYLNDEERIKSVIRSEIRKGRGPHYIAAKLKMLGVFSHALRELYPREEEIEQVKKILQKRSAPKNPQKLFMHLRRKGFSLDIIRKFVL